jgi:cytochrome c
MLALPLSMMLTHVNRRAPNPCPLDIGQAARGTGGRPCSVRLAFSPHVELAFAKKTKIAEEAVPMKRPVSAWSIAGILVAGLWAAQAQAAPDVAKAEALMKKSGCNKCHALSAKKEGPPYKETAAKYKGKADGADKLYTHLTTNPKVKVEGKEELHESLKTKNDADIKNVVEYILSR